MQGLNQKEILLALSKKIDTLLVACDHHAGEHFITLSLAFDLEVLDNLLVKTALPLFLSS